MSAASCEPCARPISAPSPHRSITGMGKDCSRDDDGDDSGAPDLPRYRGAIAHVARTIAKIAYFPVRWIINNSGTGPDQAIIVCVGSLAGQIGKGRLCEVAPR